MASEKKNDGLQLVPEVVLKRKHDLDEMKANRAAQAIINPKGNRKVFRKTKVVKVQKPETILAKSRAMRNHSIRYKRVLKKGMQKRASNSKIEKTKVVIPEGLKDAEEELELQKEVNFIANSVGAKMVFIIRIREPNGMPKNVKKILNNMKLKSINEGTFRRYDEATKKKLHLIEPWVTYGIPSKNMINDLIRRRGHGKIDGKRIRLSDNVVVEKALSDETEGAVICVDDMVHELHMVGNEFKKVNSFLWTFQLSSSKTKFQKEKLGYKEGGDYGDRGEEIDDLIIQML
eukprot:157503_1